MRATGALLISLGVAACGGAESLSITIAAPSYIRHSIAASRQQKVEVSIAREKVPVDFDSSTGQFRAEAGGIEKGAREVRIEYSVSSVSGLILVASYSTVVPVEAGKTTRLVVSPFDFDTSFDDDADQVTNLREAVLGSDPKKRELMPDPPNLVLVPDHLSTLQSALDFVQKGDVICVNPPAGGGSYTEFLKFQQSEISFMQAAFCPHAIGSKGTVELRPPQGAQEQKPLITIEPVEKTMTVIGPGGVPQQKKTTEKISTVNIEGFVFGGAAAQSGAAIYLSKAVAVSILNNYFYGNSAQERGGAVYALAVNGMNIWNNIFDSNSAGARGGAVAVEASSSVAVSFNTFYNNSAPKGASVYWEGSIVVLNSIFDSADGDTTEAVTPPHSFVRYNLFWIDASHTVNVGSPLGPGNVNADPMFADPSAGDFTLGETSAAKTSAEDGGEAGAFGEEGHPPRK